MKTKIIKMGNSRGIRIPKALLEQTSLTEEVDIQVKDGNLVVSPIAKPRAGWTEAFARAGKDEELWEEIPLTLSTWDDEEWEW